MKKIIEKILSRLSLKKVGDMRLPNEGRIAHNYIVCTKERGDILIRLYPPHFEKRQFLFEVDVLQYLGEKDVCVPRLLTFSSDEKADEKKYIEIEGWYIFAYPLLPGNCATLEALNSDVVYQASQMLLHLLVAGQSYQPNDTAPHGDFSFIENIFERALKRISDARSHSSIQNMLARLHDSKLQDFLNQTPRGIVHADYFYENIILDPAEKDVIGVIDFGDAYYGHLIMDIAIGAMEFSIINEEIKPELFSVFLNVHSSWLYQNHISFELFYQMLLINCIRFVAHTLNLELDAKGKININENVYVKRYQYLKSDNTKILLSGLYDKLYC